MKNYIIYDVTGRILQNGTCPDDMLELQGSPDRGVLEGEGTSETHYVIEGQLCAYSEAELLIKRTLLPGWAWKMPERIAVDMRDLITTKNQVWGRIKRERTIRELSPFVYDGNEYDSNKEQIGGAAQLALLSQLSGSPFSINWTIRNNSVVVLNAQQMINVGIALGVHVNNAYNTGRSLRDQINESTTNEELDAIIWPVE